MDTQRKTLTMRAQAIRRKIAKKAILAGRELPKSISPGGRMSATMMPQTRKIPVAQLKAFRTEFPLSDSNHDGCMFGTGSRQVLRAAYIGWLNEKTTNWASGRQYR
jgi:hypothetical protein